MQYGTENSINLIKALPAHWNYSFKVWGETWIWDPIIPFCEWRLY